MTEYVLYLAIQIFLIPLIKMSLLCGVILLVLLWQQWVMSNE